VQNKEQDTEWGEYEDPEEENLPKNIHTHRQGL
jgi:hypothetical protein